MRFTIRDLLWLTVVVALGVGWAVDHWQPVTTSRIKAMLLRAGYYATDGDGDILEYMTTDGGTTVTVWEFSDDRPMHFSSPAASPNSSAPDPNPPKK